MISRWCTFNESTCLKQLSQDSAWHLRFCPPYTPLCKHFSEKQNNGDNKIPLALRLCFTIVGGLCGNLKVIFSTYFLCFYPKIWVGELGYNFFKCVAHIPVFTVKLSWQKKDNEETSCLLTQTKLVYVIKRCCNFCHIVWTPK